MRYSFKRNLYAALTGLALLTAPAMVKAEDDKPVPTIQIEKSWARASIGSGRPAAVYFTVRNNGAEADYLTGVSTPAAGHADIHVMEEENGVTSMRPAGEIEIPPGETVSLKPGGLHVMLMHLKEPLKEGSTVHLSAVFKEAGSIAIDVPVLSPGAMEPEKE